MKVNMMQIEQSQNISKEKGHVSDRHITAQCVDLYEIRWSTLGLTFDASSFIQSIFLICHQYYQEIIGSLTAITGTICHR